MTKRTLLFLIASLTITFASGCLFSRKASKPKENPAIAAELEESFRQRWIEKRAAELVSKNLAPDLARAQAMEEFKARYNFPEARQK